MGKKVWLPVYDEWCEVKMNPRVTMRPLNEPTSQPIARDIIGQPTAGTMSVPTEQKNESAQTSSSEQRP